MAITLVQKNGAVQTGTLVATPPAWGSSPVAGNLLLMCCAEANSTAGTWGTLPAGYTKVTTTPFVYSTTTGNPHGWFWKIAAGGDATPGTYGETTATQDWVTYTYEFNSPTGWITTPTDKIVQSASSNTPALTKAAPTTGTLSQASELVIAMLAADAAATACTFDNSLVLATPTTNNAKLWVAWKEVAATTALTVTATWTTTSRVAGIRVVSFMPAAPSGIMPHKPYFIRRRGSGA